MQKKNILLMGSTGFIGKNIYNYLKNNPDINITRYSTKNNRFIDNPKVKSFKILIFASGIHKRSTYQNNDIFLKSKKNIKKILYFIDKVEKIIFISSFKTSFNSNMNLIENHTKYNFYTNDSNYGKSKFLNEKMFLYICKKKKKKFTILCPTHVIGPEKKISSLNNNDIKKIYNKFLIFYPECNISLIDVRNLSYFIKKVIYSNNYDNKKIIANDKTITYFNYIHLIKNKQFFLAIKVHLIVLKILHKIQNILINLNIIKEEYINKSQLAYIEANPAIKINSYIKKIPFEKTIEDIKKLL